MPEDPAAVLAQAAPAVAQVARELMTLLRERHPSATVMGYPGWKSIAFAHGSKVSDWYCALALHGKWVNLQLVDGSKLDDPAGMLEGSGKTARHVKVTSLDAIDLEAALTLVDLARERALQQR